jgi:hypothetical protein
MSVTVTTPSDLAAAKASLQASIDAANKAIAAIQSAQATDETNISNVLQQLNALGAQLTELTNRVAALEAPVPAPTPAPTPSPDPSPAPTPQPTPAPTPTPAPAPSPAPTPAPPPSPSPTPSGALPAGVTLKDPDGGTNYWSKFTGPTFPTSPSFFPIGVWYEGTSTADQVAFDSATGLNTYMRLITDSRLDLIRAGGMFACLHPDDLSMPNRGTETTSYMTEDEPDMIPGWWGAPTAQQMTDEQNRLAGLPKDGRPVYANVGLGILSCDDGDADAQKYVRLHDFISADQYFYTESTYEMCRTIGQGTNRLTDEQARRGRNYGIVVERMRAFMGYTKPVWGFVEAGAPSSSTGIEITPAQIRAAIWHCIIGGARGILFFNHSFSGANQSQHVLREAHYAPVRAQVQAETAIIRQLTPALNGPDALGLVTASTGVKAAAKWNGGAPVVIAGNTDHTARTGTFTLAGLWSSVTVVGENRTIPVAGGTFTDSFPAETTIHVYQVNP